MLRSIGQLRSITSRFRKTEQKIESVGIKFYSMPINGRPPGEKNLEKHIKNNHLFSRNESGHQCC